MLALPRLNSDHRHARVDKQPGHKGDGDTLSPPALVVFELSVTQGMKSSRQSWSRHGLHFKGALSPTLQSDSLWSTSISLPGCNPRWNPGQVSGEWGATLGVNKPPTAFLRRADDSNKNLSSSALWGARSLSRGKLFYCTLPAVRVRFKWRGSARNASWTSCWWGIPWGTMGAPPRYYLQLGGAHRQHGVVVRHLFYTWTPPCLVCRAQGCYSRGCWCWDVHIPNQCAHFCLCYVYSCSLVDWALDWKEDLGCYLSPTSASVSNQCHLRVAAFAVVAFSRWEATDFLKLRQELDIPAQGRRFQLTFLYFIGRCCR